MLHKNFKRATVPEKTKQENMSSQNEESLDPYFQPSKLTENYARLCHLIFTICSDLLRDIIGRHISPSELTNTIDNERNVLWNKFSKQQQKEIYPEHARVLKAKDFDISLCYILLRNICGILPHAAGWGKDPEPGDYSVSACIEIIKIERNKVCAHSARGTIDQPEFQDHWNKIKEAVIHLEQKEIGGDWYERGVDCLWSCSLSPFKNEEYIEEMKEVKSKLDGIDGCIRGFQATVGIKMACKRARLDLLEESQSATLTDISDQIEDLQNNVVQKVEKVHGLQNHLIDIQQKIGDDDSSDVDPCEEGKVPSTDSCDTSRINCFTSDRSPVDEEFDSFRCPNRSKSFELRFKENERVIWVCSWKKTCWIISLCLYKKVDIEHNQYKIYTMNESIKGLKLIQELTIHEPFVQGIDIDKEGRLVFLSQSKMCARYVTKQNTIHTLTDLNERCVSYALCIDNDKMKVIARRGEYFFVTDKLKNDDDDNDDDDDDDDDETHICAHLDMPRRLFKKKNSDPSVYAVLHEGITILKKNPLEEMFEVSVIIHDGSRQGLLDMAVIENLNLKGILLAYSNGIDLLDWEGNFHKRIYNETVDKIRTISVSGRNLWIGHESNTIDRIDFDELDLRPHSLLN